MALGCRVEPTAGGAELVQACLSRHCQFQVPRGKAYGRTLLEAERSVLAELRKEKYDAHEAA